MRKPDRPLEDDLPPLQSNVTRVVLSYPKKRWTWSRGDVDIHLYYDARLKPLQVMKMLRKRGYIEVYNDGKKYRVWEKKAA